MYKTSPFQYHRKVMGAVRNLSLNRGNISGNLKTIAIYHVILPQLFQIVGNGFKWDKDDQLRALGFGNINEIFVAGDIMKGITNALQGLPWDYQFTPVESTWRTGQKFAKHVKAIFEAAENVSMTEVWKAIEDLAIVVGDVTGAPLHGAVSSIKGAVDVAAGNTERPVRRIMGWSEQSMEGGVGFFDASGPENDKLKTLINDTKNPTIEEINKMDDVLYKRKELSIKKELKDSSKDRAYKNKFNDKSLKRKDL